MRRTVSILTATAAALLLASATQAAALFGARVGAADAPKVAKFYQSVFGLQETNRLELPNLFEIMLNFGDSVSAAKENKNPGVIVIRRESDDIKDTVPHLIFTVTDLTATIAAVTVGQMGERLTEIEDLVAAGAVAISDDGKPVRNAELMRRALELTRRLGVPVIQHAEDPDLKGDGVMHEGWTSTRLGMKGIPDAAESVMVARDALLAELTGGHVHVAHVSAARSVEIIRRAKARGIKMTAETAPHYLILTDEAVEGYDPRTKMNPPLRSAKDRDALIEAVADGTLDCLATDHAPHTEIEKDSDFDAAPFGIVGLETALGVLLKALVEPKHLSMPELILRMTANPLRVLGLPGGTLEAGTPADVTIFDPARRWTVRAAEFASMGRNTPFEGWELKGLVLLTMLGGKITYRAQPLEVSAR